MPVIRVQDRIEGLKPGDQLVANCSDPGVLSDIPAWCRINGHQVLEVIEQNGEYTLVILVGNGR